MIGTQPDYQLLAVFVAVAEQQSFTKAARKLGIGKGTASRAIADLERQLGTELLHRTTHEVALSTAGVALYERTAPHLAALDQAVLKLPERAAEPSGELRISSLRDFGVVVLPDVLAHFARRYPEVRVDLRLTNVRVDLVAQGFDLAILGTVGALKDSSLMARRLGSTGVGFYAAPSYLTRRGKPRRLGEAGHDWIVHPRTGSVLKMSLEVAPRFVIDDALLVRDLVRDGGGIGLLPQFVAAPYVRDGLLEEVPDSDRPSWKAVLYLVYHPSRGQVSRKVIAFRDFLLEWLKESPLA